MVAADGKSLSSGYDKCAAALLLGVGVAVNGSAPRQVTLRCWRA